MATQKSRRYADSDGRYHPGAKASILRRNTAAAREARKVGTGAGRPLFQRLASVFELFFNLRFDIHRR